MLQSLSPEYELIIMLGIHQDVAGHWGGCLKVKYLCSCNEWKSTRTAETRVENHVEYIPYATRDSQVPQMMQNSKIMGYHRLKSVLMNKKAVYSMSTFQEKVVTSCALISMVRVIIA